MDSVWWSTFKKLGLLKRVFKKPFLNDEPKVFGFGAELDLRKIKTDGNLPDTFGSGTSSCAGVALSKAIFECIERLNLSEFKFKDFLFDSYKNISKLSVVVNPNDLCYFSNEQLKDSRFRDFCFSSKCKFYWTKCINLDTGQNAYLPAQSIYCPYKYQDNEKIISFPITTGASVANNKEEAIYKGLCEVIERDAYMTNYILRLKPKEILYQNLKSKEISELIELFKKYKLRIKSYVLVSDLKIPTILSVIIDETNNGPLLSIGLKTEWNLKNAIIGSIEESFQVRYWIRTCMIKNEWTGDTYTSDNMLKRAFLWKDGTHIKNLDFILNSPYKFEISDKKLVKYIQTTPKEKLKMIKKVLVTKGVDAYYKDVTSKRFRNLDVTVMKCVIPSLHPMFIDQNFPYLGGLRIQNLMRMYKIKKLNKFPHPFL